jgi:hypothetical protein
MDRTWARRAAIAGVLAVLVAACGSAATPSPSSTEGAHPSPTATETPSPTAAPSATPTPSPQVTPAPTGAFDATKLAADIESGAAKTEYPAVTTAKLKIDFQTLLDNNSSARSDTVLKRVFDSCMNPDKSFPTWMSDQGSLCVSTARHLGNLARATNDPNVIDTTDEFIGWSLGSQGPAVFDRQTWRDQLAQSVLPQSS